MYTQPFTSSWHLDRCLDAAWITRYIFLNPYFLAIALTLFFFFGFKYFDSFFKKKAASLNKKIGLASLILFYGIKLLSSIILGILLALPMMVLVIVVSIFMGYFVLACSMGPLWDRVKPAHEVHATLKQIRENGGQTPQSLEELKQINPNAYKKIEGKAKIEYEYIPENNGYHFTVRPSKYYLADFSDEHDYVLYESTSIFSEAKSE